LREPTEAANLAELYDEDPMPWSRVNDAIGTGSIPPEVPCFLGTVRPDGRPHAAGVGVAHYDGNLYFTSGPGTRKARNLSGNPACTLSLRLEGVDVVFEGEARRVIDHETLDRVASVFREGGWPAESDGDAITAPYSAVTVGKRGVLSGRVKTMPGCLRTSLVAIGIRRSCCRRR
jgi:hypothetical protein